MDQDLSDLVARARDPRWIPAIYNYCDGRCARCRFNDRCFSFAEQRRERGTDQDALEATSTGLEQAVRLLQVVAEREGTNLDELSTDDTESIRAAAGLANDALVAKAREYSFAAYRLLHSLDTGAAAGTMSREVREAIDSILWLSTPIASKVFRAVSSLGQPFEIDNHPTQNDAHGSAKVARLMIGESLGAWRVLNEEGCAPIDSPTWTVMRMLESIDRDLAERIPRAMEFVRPGFDEPIPGLVRPWSLTEDDERGDRRFLAASAILTKLKGFGRGLLPRFKRAHEPVSAEPGTANAEPNLNTNRER
jgi:hypothetical protein